jgi:hypothetical protein
MQAGLWTVAGAAAVLVAVAGFADRRRAHRRDLDRAGWVPWPMIMILAMIVAAAATAIAIKS